MKHELKNKKLCNFYLHLTDTNIRIKKKKKK